jgi:hypothetical protein
MNCATSLVERKAAQINAFAAYAIRTITDNSQPERNCATAAKTKSVRRRLVALHLFPGIS